MFGAEKELVILEDMEKESPVKSRISSFTKSNKDTMTLQGRFTFLPPTGLKNSLLKPKNLHSSCVGQSVCYPFLWKSYQQVLNRVQVSLPGSLQQLHLKRKVRPGHPPQHFVLELRSAHVERRLLVAVAHGHISAGVQQLLHHLSATAADTPGNNTT